MEHGDWLAPLINQEIIAEIGEGFTVFGTLVGISSGHLELRDVDLHNQHEANSTRDVYAMETKEIGIRPTRARLFVPRDRLIAISTLADVRP